MQRGQTVVIGFHWSRSQFTIRLLIAITKSNLSFASMAEQVLPVSSSHAVIIRPSPGSQSATLSNIPSVTVINEAQAQVCCCIAFCITLSLPLFIVFCIAV